MTKQKWKEFLDINEEASHFLDDNKEMIDFICYVQVALSHLLQDGEILPSAIPVVEGLLKDANDLSDKFTNNGEK